MPTFSSVAIYFALDEDILHCKKLIEDFINNQSNLIFKKDNDDIGVLHTIHVNYNGKDLHRVAEEKKLNNKELIDIHSNKIYIVQFLGFIPGFAYLGTLDKRISLPRKKILIKMYQKVQLQLQKIIQQYILLTHLEVGI